MGRPTFDLEARRKALRKTLEVRRNSAARRPGAGRPRGAAEAATAAALPLGERPIATELVGAAIAIAGLLCGLARRPQSQSAYGSVAPARAS